MQDKKIVIIGDSPAAYTCAIYLFTANMSPIIIKKDMNLEYSCTFVPGVDAEKAEYNQRCLDQAKHMGITIFEAEKISVVEANNKYTVNYDDKSIESDVLVLDMPLNLKQKENLFIVDSLLLEREAIVVAGVGCMIAFEIKEMIH